MTNLSDIYDIASRNDVTVVCFQLDTVDSMSHMTKSGNCYIGIDPLRINSVAEERDRLAHELGHCVCGAFYNIYSPFDIREKHEVKAERWAIKQLIPYSELNAAICDGVCTAWELAEYFDLPERFIIKAINYYTQAKGMRFGNPEEQMEI